ncbi:unnamed protein product [Vitrella brassicaformis CCMP3155]|uniref:Uncharacterized protein n=1 Tax=Vitrella brassicaformis (strain CCMP3155) TaxID=1169540 RepID=A0A0G4GI72_VITBC|nr:unnamed protein product [Vitrella brassicaformis CCMP3155]|eukprot:CEM29467.1 unnamed protein product [Vitrella brassicaformis CCMP3155]
MSMGGDGSASERDRLEVLLLDWVLSQEHGAAAEIKRAFLATKSRMARDQQALPLIQVDLEELDVLHMLDAAPELGVLVVQRFTMFYELLKHVIWRLLSNLDQSAAYLGLDDDTGTDMTDDDKDKYVPPSKELVIIYFSSCTYIRAPVSSFSTSSLYAQTGSLIRIDDGVVISCSPLQHRSLVQVFSPQCMCVKDGDGMIDMGDTDVLLRVSRFGTPIKPKSEVYKCVTCKKEYQELTNRRTYTTYREVLISVSQDSNGFSRTPLTVTVEGKLAETFLQKYPLGSRADFKVVPLPPSLGSTNGKVRVWALDVSPPNEPSALLGDGTPSRPSGDVRFYECLPMAAAAPAAAAAGHGGGDSYREMQFSQDDFSDWTALLERAQMLAKDHLPTDSCGIPRVVLLLSAALAYENFLPLDPQLYSFWSGNFAFETGGSRWEHHIAEDEEGQVMAAGRMDDRMSMTDVTSATVSRLGTADMFANDLPYQPIHCLFTGDDDVMLRKLLLGAAQCLPHCFVFDAKHHDPTTLLLYRIAIFNLSDDELTAKQREVFTEVLSHGRVKLAKAGYHRANVTLWAFYVTGPKKASKSPMSTIKPLLPYFDSVIDLTGLFDAMEPTSLAIHVKQEDGEEDERIADSCALAKVINFWGLMEVDGGNNAALGDARRKTVGEVFERRPNKQQQGRQGRVRRTAPPIPIPVDVSTGPSAFSLSEPSHSLLRDYQGALQLHHQALTSLEMRTIIKLAAATTKLVRRPVRSLKAVDIAIALMFLENSRSVKNNAGGGSDGVAGLGSFSLAGTDDAASPLQRFESRIATLFHCY